MKAASSTTTTCSMSEEAFLLSSLREVVNIWGRGTGQASFNLTVNEGVADLQLGFKLGMPGDAHLHHEHPEPLHHQHAPEQEQVAKKRRRKGPSRRQRDRARAAVFQARKQPEAVILPFHGKILPLFVSTAVPVVKRTASNSSQSDSPAAAEPAVPRTPSKPAHSDSSAAGSATASAVARTPSTSLLSDAPAAAPVKASKLSSTATSDVSSVRKHLFVADHREPPPSNPSLQTKNYKQKENDLWTKLFKN